MVHALSVYLKKLTDNVLFEWLFFCLSRFSLVF
jgi:hypothetical protein